MFLGSPVLGQAAYPWVVQLEPGLHHPRAGAEVVAVRRSTAWVALVGMAGVQAAMRPVRRMVRVVAAQAVLRRSPYLAVQGLPVACL